MAAESMNDKSMQRLIYQGKLHCSDAAGFSIGGIVSFAVVSIGATSLRSALMQNQDQPPGRGRGGEERLTKGRGAWKASYDMNEIRRLVVYSPFPRIQSPVLSLPARYNSRIFLHHFTRIPAAQRPCLLSAFVTMDPTRNWYPTRRNQASRLREFPKQTGKLFHDGTYDSRVLLAFACFPSSLLGENSLVTWIFHNFGINCLGSLKVESEWSKFVNETTRSWEPIIRRILDLN